MCVDDKGVSWAKEGSRFAYLVKAWAYCYKIKKSTLIQGFMASHSWLAFLVTATVKELFSFLFKTQKRRAKWLKHLKYKAVNFMYQHIFSCLLIN